MSKWRISSTAGFFSKKSERSFLTLLKQQIQNNCDKSSELEGNLRRLSKSGLKEYIRLNNCCVGPKPNQVQTLSLAP